MKVIASREERVQRLAEEQYLTLVRSEERGTFDGTGYRLVDPVTGTPIAAIGLPQGPWQSLTEIEHELVSGVAADALRHCQKLFGRAAEHGLMLEPRREGKSWIWNVREICGMPVASDMSYSDLRRFLEQYQEPPVTAWESGTESSAGTLDFSLTAY
jgi:hypothetical protein